MSGFVSEPLRSDEHQFAAGRNGEKSHSHGQRHDRIPGGTGGGPSAAMTSTDEVGPEPDMEISAGQNMLSAVSGSLLTSLLGESTTSFWNFDI